MKKGNNMSKEQDVFNSHKIIAVTKVIAKVAEVICWALVAGMIAMLIWSICSPDSLLAVMSKPEMSAQSLNCLGFSLASAEGTSLTGGMATAFAVVSVLLSALMAMVFRNTYLILKTADGKSWFAKSDTPFQGDIVRMLREIGIFLIGLPVVSLLAMLIVGGIFPEAELASANLVGLVLGLLMLCLSQFFNYGAKLEKDTKGLI